MATKHAYMHWAWTVPLTVPSHRLVLVSLADQANDDGECWPSQRTIASRCCLQERQVRRILAEFEERGLISREERRRQDGSRTSDVFSLQITSGTPVPVVQGTTGTPGPGVGSPMTAPPGRSLPGIEPPVEPPVNHQGENAHALARQDEAVVWRHYRETFPDIELPEQPSRQDWALIRAATRLRSVPVCCEAITGLCADEFYASRRLRGLRHAFGIEGRVDGAQIDRMAATGRGEVRASSNGNGKGQTEGQRRRAEALINAVEATGAKIR